MAKVVFRDLPLGLPAQTSDVWGNLDKVATALSGNIEAEQLKNKKATFSVPCFFTRLAGSFIDPASQSDEHIFAFACPPLQENFDDVHFNEDETTPQVTLESVCISFDNVNARYPIVDSTGLSNSSLSWDAPMEVRIELGSGQVITRVTIPQVTLDQDNEDIVNRPNPTINAYVGATIPRYEWVYVAITSPNLAVTGGINSVLVHAILSADVVERDTATLIDTYVTGTGNIAQNAPAHDLARSNASVSLTTPADASLIMATGVSGVQTAIETLDTSFLDGLGGSLDRLGNRDPNGENCKDDSSYFITSVPLFRVEYYKGIDNNTNPMDAYEYVNADLPATTQSYLDKAIIPITVPGCIHHVFCVFGPVSAAAGYSMRATCGVGIGNSVRSKNILYQQVAYREQFDIKNLSGFRLRDYLETNLHSIPLVYQTGTKIGKGFVTQGRPFYYGREIVNAAGGGRNNAATSNPASAEAAPSTVGQEQVLEVRMTISVFRASTGAYVDPSTVTHQAGGSLGATVYIVGKHALVE